MVKEILQMHKRKKIDHLEATELTDVHSDGEIVQGRSVKSMGEATSCGQEEKTEDFEEVCLNYFIHVYQKLNESIIK